MQLDGGALVTIANSALTPKLCNISIYHWLPSMIFLVFPILIEIRYGFCLPHWGHLLHSEPATYVHTLQRIWERTWFVTTSTWAQHKIFVVVDWNAIPGRWYGMAAKVTCVRLSKYHISKCAECIKYILFYRKPLGDTFKSATEIAGHSIDELPVSWTVGLISFASLVHWRIAARSIKSPMAEWFENLQGIKYPWIIETIS